MLGRRHFLAIVGIGLASSPLLAAEPSPTLTKAFLDLSLEPPSINTAPGPEYADEARSFGMVIGMDRTPKGRIWACWVGGGDNQNGFFVAATSDDGGETWSKPRLVVDPTDPPGPVKRRTLVGNFWTDPSGTLWLFFDQSMGYFDGRGGVWATTCDEPGRGRAGVVRAAPHLARLHAQQADRPEERRVAAAGLALEPRPDHPADLEGRVPRAGRPAHGAPLRLRRSAAGPGRGAGGVRFPGSEFDEHMTVELRDGRLWMLARTNYGGIAESYSTDAGRTWSLPQPSIHPPPQRAVPHPPARVRPAAARQARPHRPAAAEPQPSDRVPVRGRRQDVAGRPAARRALQGLLSRRIPGAGRPDLHPLRPQSRDGRRDPHGPIPRGRRARRPLPVGRCEGADAGQQGTRRCRRRPCGSGSIAVR